MESGNNLQSRSALVPVLALFGLLVFVALVLLTPANAQGGRGSNAIFTVPMVPVYAEAETSAQAQAKAQAMGRREAMDLLLRRLTAEEDWQYLPRLASGEPAPAASDFDAAYQPSQMPAMNEFDAFALGPEPETKQPVAIAAADLPRLEEGFAIFDERSSATTYRARITYRFKPAAVRALLQAAQLPYSEAQARRALVVPVLETENGSYLWEARNPWARAWLSRPLVNELTPLLLPVGDRQDIESATVEQAQEFDAFALAQLAARYRTDQVLIARGVLDEAGDEFVLRVQLVEGYLDTSGASSTGQANTAAILYDDDTGFGEAGQTASSDAGRVLTDLTFRGPNDDFPALAKQAVESTVFRHARGWKAQTLVDHAASRTFILTAWFANLSEWGMIRQALEDTPLVRNMEVGAFNNSNAVMQLTVIGDADQFTLAMQQASLTVWQDANSRWNIAGFDRAQRLMARREIAETPTPNFDGAQLNRRDGFRNDQPISYEPDPYRQAPGVADEPQDAFPGDAPVLLDGPQQLEPAPLGPNTADDGDEIDQN